MTIVIAQQFGERIVIQSDTAITNEPTGPDVIPGRLKAIVLSPKISVAFAGAADRADWVIRQSPSILRNDGLRGLLDWLVKHTRATEEHWDNSVSYIVASHLNGAELYHVWDSRCSNSLPRTWVGDESVYRAFRQAECQAPTEYIDGHSIEDENRFGIAFNELFYSSRHGADFSIRGFAVNLLASPLGHCYQPMTVSYDPNPIKIGLGVGGGQMAWLESPGLWSCSIYGTRYRGVGVAGALVPQLGLSFIYAPILDRRAARFPLRSVSSDWHDHEAEMISKLRSELDRVAEVVGGGIIVG